MAITLVQHIEATGTSTAPAATFSGGTTSGNAIIVKLAYLSAGGNATIAGYTADASYQPASYPYAYIFSKLNVSAGITTVTAALSGSSVRWVMCIEEWSGLATSSAFDQTAHLQTLTAGSGGTGTTPTTGQASEMLAAMIAVDGTSGSNGDFSAPTNSFTLLANLANGNPLGLATLYRVVAATGTYSTAVSDAQNPSYTGLIATYKGVGGVAASTPYSYISAGSANQDSQAIKGSAGTLYGACIVNTTNVLRYAKFYDKVSGATSADTPKLRIPIAPGKAYAMADSNGITFAAGICHRITAGPADADATAVSTSDVILNAWYQ